MRRCPTDRPTRDLVANRNGGHGAALLGHARRVATVRSTLKNAPMLVTAALVVAGLRHPPVRGLFLSLAAMGTLVTLRTR